MPYRRIPSLNWLRVFEAAARMESFSGAGRLLNMSPAAVSQQIKALETHLKTQLFKRGARDVTLTDAGLAFLPVVRQSLMAVETTAASLFGHAEGASVTVQATLIFATSWLAARLRDFERIHPNIQIHVMGGYRDGDIDREGADLYITFGSAPRAWGDNELLFGEEIYPVAMSQLARKIISPEDILAHRLIEISTHRMGWMQLFEAVDDVDFSRAQFCFVDSSEIALAMAAAGYGIALARAPATDCHVERAGLEPCSVNLRARGVESYHLVCRSRGSLAPAAQHFRAWLLDATEPFR